MSDRIDVQHAHDDMETQNALLVCAYESEEKFRQNHLEGALSLEELRAMQSTLSRDRELIFYCA